MPLDRSDAGLAPTATSSPLGPGDPPAVRDGVLEQQPPRAESDPRFPDDVGAVRHLAVRTPPFWKHQPEAWFAQLESIFACQQINSDAQRFHTVVAGLDSEAVQDLLDVLRHPPAENRYAYLKRQMLERWGNSPKQQLHQLLSGLTMGDRKPTQLLRHMRQLAGDSVADEALKVRWLDLLPATVSRMLTLLRSATLDELAQTADDIIASAPDVCAIQPFRPARAPPVPSTPASTPGAAEDAMLKLLRANAAELAALRASMSQLMVATTRVLENNNHGHRAQPPRRRSRSRTPVSTAVAPAPEYCYFHRRFGMDAQNCQPPCSFRPVPAPGN